MARSDLPGSSSGNASLENSNIRQRATQIVRDARNLPCLSDASLRLINLSAQAEIDAGDVPAIVGEDMALAGRVLKVANSAYYGRPRTVGSIEQAVVLLGMDAVRNIAIASSLERCVRNGGAADGYLRRLWRHSVATATVCQAIAAQRAPEIKGEAFLAGLLHDLGILVELHAWPDRFFEVMRRVAEYIDVDEWRKAEQDVLGVSHEHIGVALLEQWQLPSPVIQAVSVHHSANQPRGADCRLGPLVHAADRLSHLCGGGLWAEPQEPFDGSWDELIDLVTGLDSDIRDLCGALWS